MRKTLTFILIAASVCSLSSCASKHHELYNQLEQVVYYNGINEHEARVIAEVKILNSTFKSFYGTTKTKVRYDDAAQKYADFWFIDFSLEMLFDAPSYLVAIDKRNGDIIFAGEYYPKKIDNLDWVIDRYERYGQQEFAPDDHPMFEKYR